jgi:esterase/lipase
MFALTKKAGWAGLRALNRMIFPGPCSKFEQCASRKAEGQRTFTSQTGKRVNYIMHRHENNPSKKLVLYFHGNAECIAMCAAYVPYISAASGADVLVPEYDGYGEDVHVQCSERMCFELADAVDEMIFRMGYAREDVAVVGYSIGSGTATYTAVELGYGRLVLVCPFTSIRDVAVYHSGLVGHVMGSRFDNASRISRYEGRLVVVHGERDSKIPCEQGHRLFELCPSEDKHLVIVGQRGHVLDPSDLVSYGPVKDILSGRKQ